MRKNLYPGGAHLYLCFVNPTLPDETGLNTAMELKSRYPYAHLVCIPAASENINKEKLYLYDRIFRKPVDLSNVLEITETVRKYYLSESEAME
ncbi:MAG: hypothetical protein JRI91_08740, partial [Deltaproteobacteria bacterium]|nr:hypothetical protein [Deltaproteobacteria bacterium]